MREQLTRGMSWLYPSVEAPISTGVVPKRSSLRWVGHSGKLSSGCTPPCRHFPVSPFPFNLYIYVGGGGSLSIPETPPRSYFWRGSDHHPEPEPAPRGAAAISFARPIATLLGRGFPSPLILDVPHL